MSEKLKILQISKFYSPFSGGIETVVQCLAETMHASGHDITVACSSVKRMGSDYNVNGVKVKSFGTLFKLLSQPISPLLILYIVFNHKKFDIIHHHIPNPVLDLILLLFVPKYKIVCTYHSDVLKYGPIQRFYNMFSIFFLNRVRRIHVPTEWHINTSEILRLVTTEKTVIPFFIDIPHYEGVNFDKLCNGVKEEHGDFILFVGRLVSYKGVKYLIQAMENIDYKLIIIGKGELLSDLNKLIIEKELQGKVQMLGHVKSHLELHAYFKMAKVFVLPSISRAENFGMVQLESFSHGTPVILSKIESGVRGVGIEGLTTIYFEPENSLDLSNVIRKSLNDEERLKELSQNCLKHYQEHYDKEKLSGEYERLYHEVVER